MPSLEAPPGFVLKNDLLKAADDLGFRVDHGLQGAWHVRSSTTAKGNIYLAGLGPKGPWLMALDSHGVVAEIGLPEEPINGPGLARYKFKNLESLRTGISRAYQLGASLPDAPLEAYLNAIEGKPQNTEVERLVVQRIGQAQFRKALLDYWDGTCSVSGIYDVDLLRASHIKPWARCDSDSERLDVHNGLLLSALWDAAFDKGLVTFSPSLKPQFSIKLSEVGKLALDHTVVNQAIRVTERHAEYLEWHRINVFLHR